MIDRFGDVCDDPMAELKRQRSVREYHEEFDSIITRLNLTEEYILSCFLGGLKKDIQMMVRMFQPNSVQHAFALAKMYEAINLGNGPDKFQRGVLGPIFMPSLENVPVTVPSKPKQQRNITPTYMAEKRAKGLCYFCDEPYLAKHYLVHKQLQIRIIEINNEEEAIDVFVSGGGYHIQGAEPQISMNALTTVAGFRTMRITSYYQRNPLHILIDSGSTTFLTCK